MIYKYSAHDVIDAACKATSNLLNMYVPEKPVWIKPNIVEPSQPPVTTDVRVVEGIIRALKETGIKDITVAEGSGTGDTFNNFRRLGYEKLDAELVDLDRETTIERPVRNHAVWKKIMVPAVLLDKFIISAPVLKEHALCNVTISLKNMVGILPAQYYSGYWSYKKSQVHRYDTHGCIADIISVVKPDWAIVDATIGLKGHHLSGTPLDPPLNLVYGSVDPLEADIFGCSLLGRYWEDVAYLKMIAERSDS